MKEAKNFAALDGPFRKSKRPNKLTYNAFMSRILYFEPINVDEALKKQAWKDAMMEEYHSILKNDVWDIVRRPKGKSIVSSKWLFKIKYAADGSIEKHKACFVARGFSQKEGINYKETFAPVARYTSIQAVLTFAVAKGWKVHQLDVKTIFLNGTIEKEVYLEKPKGFIVYNAENHVYKLKKSLYGLKQAPRAWRRSPYYAMQKRSNFRI